MFQFPYFNRPEAHRRAARDRRAEEVAQRGRARSAERRSRRSIRWSACPVEF